MGLEDLKALRLDDILACNLTAQDAVTVLGAIEALEGNDLPGLWRVVSKTLLANSPDLPFDLHKLLYQTVYKGYNTQDLGPPPCWIPTPQGAAATNAARFLQQHGSDIAGATGDPMHDWNALYTHSIKQPGKFWPAVLKTLKIKFRSPPSSIIIVNPDPDAVQWLPGAQLNIAECALVGHDPDRPAIIWAAEESPQDISSMSRGQLTRQAQAIAGALRKLGLKPGDAVAIDMPMVPEAVVAFLGIVWSGCVAVSIADSFAPQEIASRLRISRAKAIFTQDVILRRGKALGLYEKVVQARDEGEGTACRAIILAADRRKVRGPLTQGDMEWGAFLAHYGGEEAYPPHIAEASSLSGILFSSGTTGEPKAIPWTHTPPLRCATDAHFHQDVRINDVICWPTSMGWMMGPWLVYAALLNGAAMALFLGSPLERSFGEFVQAARVNVLGLVPSIARVWKSSNCMQGLDWAGSGLRCFSSTGEASAPEEYLWLSARGGYCPVIEYCGGTEIGGAFLSGTMLQPQAPSTFSTPTLGAQPVLLVGHRDGVEEVKWSYTTRNAVLGELALQMPMLGASQHLLNADHNKVYYDGMPRPGLRRHGDEMELLPNGYCRAHGRVDDTMNLGGIKVSSVELERAVVATVEEVSEAAAVAVPPPGGGPDRLILFLVVDKQETVDIEELTKKCQRAVSTRLNPLFKIEGVELVGSLPRTASNKVMRRVLRDSVMGGGVVSKEGDGEAERARM